VDTSSQTSRLNGMTMILESMGTSTGRLIRQFERQRIQYTSIIKINDMADYEPIGEMDSTRLIGEVRERFEELTADGNKPHLEWRSFYTGWLEGRVDMNNKLNWK
jgi:hypothetical protein|tara:strand:- start:1530 stop:1844 length:315 start_codon:yes stop_codon:yes gene_type:complete